MKISKHILFYILIIIFLSPFSVTYLFAQAKYTTNDYYQHGLMLKRAELYSEAIIYFKKAISNNPEPVFYRDLALTYGDMKEWDEAEQAMANAIKSNKSDGQYNFYRGTIYFKQGKNGPALKDINNAINKGFTDGQAFYYKGLILKQLGDLEGASSAFQRAIVLSPESPEYTNDFEAVLTLLKKGKQELLEQEVKQKGNIFYLKALESKKQGKFDEARVYIEKALSLNPNNKILQIELDQISKLVRETNVNIVAMKIKYFLPYFIGLIFFYIAVMFAVEYYKRNLKYRIMEKRLKRSAYTTAKKMMKKNNMKLEKTDWQLTKQKIEILLKDELTNFKIEQITQKQIDLQNRIKSLMDQTD